MRIRIQEEVAGAQGSTRALRKDESRLQSGLYLPLSMFCGVCDVQDRELRRAPIHNSIINHQSLELVHRPRGHAGERANRYYR